jgi:hypothetical protein
MTWTKSQRIGISLGALLILVNIVRWGGTATSGPTFVLGVAVLIGLILGFTGFLYWLLVAPIENAQPEKPNALLRQLGTVAVLTSGTLMTFSTTWDEIWHRRFGTGNDFLWMPHIMMYSSFAICSLIASAGILYLVLTKQGGFRSRARSEPLVALLALVSLFLLFSAPSDLLWHQIYGLDITAWSLPHITLMLGFVSVILCGAILALSNQVSRVWRGLQNLALNEWLTFWLCGSALMFLLQFGTTEWESITTARYTMRNPEQIFWQRPEWLFTATILAVTGFIGMFVQNATKRIGAASLVGLFLLIQRSIALFVLGGNDLGMTLRAQIMATCVLITLDLIAYWQKSGTWTIKTAFSSGALAIIVVLLGVAQFFVYPRVNLETIIWHVLFGGVAWLGFTYAGALFGSSVANMPKLEVVRVAWLPKMTVAVLTGAMTVLAVALLTAKPPF